MSRLSRARSLLARPGAWIDASDGRTGGYPLRLGPDRRARVTLTLDEAGFRSLIDVPGLKGRAGGGWVARSVVARAGSPETGSPGRIEGVRAVIEADGRLITHRANLGESPLAWLARRKDSAGRAWLSLAEAAAGDRLRRDAEIAQSGPSLTMRWDALPHSGGGTAARVEPGDRAIGAARRVAAALAACPADTRAFVEHICVRGTALQLAEQDFGLRRRGGKAVLKAGLQALAGHYGIG